ncbi:MAG TPA: hypothetical protein VNB90_15180 [Cytophagaceae bacterium]|jgi:hypothetical protein|nr:hypothetical protein [Cytophagaceae bacterium]
MTIEKRIETIQKEYFDFCLGLLKKIPQDNIGEELFDKLFKLRDELQNATLQYQNNVYSEAINQVKNEIEKLKLILKSKESEI